MQSTNNIIKHMEKRTIFLRVNPNLSLSWDMCNDLGYKTNQVGLQKQQFNNSKMIQLIKNKFKTNGQP